MMAEVEGICLTLGSKSSTVDIDTRSRWYSQNQGPSGGHLYRSFQRERATAGAARLAR